MSNPQKPELSGEVNGADVVAPSSVDEQLTAERPAAERTESASIGASAMGAIAQPEDLSPAEFAGEIMKKLQDVGVKGVQTMSIQVGNRVVEFDDNDMCFRSGKLAKDFLSMPADLEAAFHFLTTEAEDEAQAKAEAEAAAEAKNGVEVKA
ncbi:MAG: hypothetical protein WC843_00395 [Candidatus Gracilibacteria bacterium]|jgi:hypothetical protein